MNDIVRAFLWIVLLLAGLAGYFVVLEALFAKRVARTRALAASAPGRSFGIGAVNFVFFSVIAVILFSASDGASGVLRALLTFPALLIVAVLATALSFGLAAVAVLVGERALPEATALKRSIWGTVFLGLACALPLAGWFLLLPYAGLTGIGAFILGFFQRESS
jgi:hypothetical protein